MKTKPVRATVAIRPSGPPPIPAPVQEVDTLLPSDRSLLLELEAKVDKAMSDFWVAMKEIRDYKGGIFWKVRKFSSFGEYARDRFDFSEQHAGRLAAAGAFVLQLENVRSTAPLPSRECQVRPLLTKLPADHLVRCWEKITATQTLDQLTPKSINEGVLEYRKTIPAEDQKRERAPKKTSLTIKKLKQKRSHALNDNLKTSTAKLPFAVEIRELLDRLEILVDREKTPLTKQVSGIMRPKLVGKPVKKAPPIPRLPEGSRPAKKVSKLAKKPAPKLVPRSRPAGRRGE